MRIAIHIDNRNISNIDCSDLLRGNPGIGGTEYCFLLLAQTLKLFYPHHETILFTEKDALLPNADKVVKVNGLQELMLRVRENECDILLINSLRDGLPLPQEILDLMNEHELKVVLWAHNFYYSDYCKRIAKCDAVKANVFVGRQQYDRYIDHRIISKSTFIFNMYPLGSKTRTEISEPSVTYIGSLVPSKGFHILAEAWKQILKKVPNAKLNVIGSGKLYNQTCKLGEFGIAEEGYEKSFMNYLLDEKGELLSSVHFLGVLGAEKSEVIAKTSVGVVNPSGKTETFGISALDFESMCVPVVTIAAGGFLDTVIDKKTGLLYKNKKDLASCVAELLTDEARNILYGKAARELAESFNPEAITAQWVELFEKITSGQAPVEYQKPSNFLTNNLKPFRRANRTLKKAFHIKGGFSVIGLESFAKKLLRRLGK